MKKEKAHMEMNKKCSVAILVSGNGSNLQAIIDKMTLGELNIDIKVVISNKADAYGLERARKAGIATEVFSFKDFQNRAEIRPCLPTGRQECGEDRDIIRHKYCQELALLVKRHKIDLVVLAGWMLVLKDGFLKEFPMKVINLHPALIPAFPGTHGIEQAFNYGSKITGVTVHFVPDEGVDSGPIILQEAVKIGEDETLESLESRIHAVEHSILPEAIRLFSEGKLIVEGRKVRVIQ